MSLPNFRFCDRFVCRLIMLTRRQEEPTRHKSRMSGFSTAGIEKS